MRKCVLWGKKSADSQTIIGVFGDGISQNSAMKIKKYDSEKIVKIGN